MFSNYLKIGIRRLLKHKGNSAVNIFGLTVGVLCCLLILTYIRYERSFDTFVPHADRIYRITEFQTFPGKDRQHVAVTAGLMAPTMKREYPEVEAATRMMKWGQMVFHFGDQNVPTRNVVYADSNVFSFFGFQLAAGDPATALAHPYSVVLTASFAQSLFGGQDPMGKTVVGEYQIPLKITGIVNDPPENSHIRFDALISWNSTTTAATARNYTWMNNWRAQSTYSYLRLTPGADVPAFQKRLPDFVKNHMPERIDSYVLSLQPFLDIHLHSSDLLYDFNASKGDAITTIVLGWIAVFILLIACVNFMNLATARSMQRAREVGLRRVVGAYRAQVAGQFLGESVLTTLIAMVLAVVAVQFVLPAFSQLANRTLSFNVLQDPMLIAGAFGLAVVAGVLAGSYPAIYLSTFRPAEVLRGGPTRGARGVLFRRVLVVFQFTIAVALIVGTIVIENQLEYVRHARLGFDKEQLLVIDRPGPQNQVEAVKTELRRSPLIVNVAGSSRVPGHSMPTFSAYPQNTGDERWDLPIIDVDYDFLKTYHIGLAEGRNFSPQFPSDEQKAVMINETMAKQLGWTSPVGKEIRLGSPDAIPHVVIGVVRDFHVKSLHEEIEPLMLDYNPNRTSNLTIRIEPGASREAVEFIRSVVAHVAPQTPFEYSFLDDQFNSMYRADEQAENIVGLFSLLAILVASLGLFGLASYTAEQRTKEIGLRKVLGASVTGIVALLSREFLALIGIATLIAWPIAWIGMSMWLEGFAYRISLDAWTFLAAGALTVAVALLTVSIQAVKAALANPADALRYE